MQHQGRTDETTPPRQTLARLRVRLPPLSQMDRILGILLLFGRPTDPAQITPGRVRFLARQAVALPGLPSPISVLNNPIISNPLNPASYMDKDNDQMTDFDRRLIEKAEDFRRYDYIRIDSLIMIADTPAARKRLHEIRAELHDLVLDTL